jgi:hypothetical protein
MLRRGTVLVAATRQAALIASAVVAFASVGSAQTTYKLTIPTVYSAGTGYLGTAQVTSTPAGIDCRSEASGEVVGGGACSADFPAGTIVTLTATPLYGGTLDGWVNACAGQGATCQLEMTQALMTSPKVIAKTYTLTIRAKGNVSGRIGTNFHLARPPLACTIQPGGVTTGVCTTEYPANQVAWLFREVSVAFTGRFLGYTGCDPNPDPGDCRFIVDGPRTITVGWMAMEIIIRSAGGNGTGKVTAVGPVNYFDCTITSSGATGACSVKIWEAIPPPSITLTATPTGNSVFAGWSGKCSGTGSCVIPSEIDTLPVAALFTVPSHTLSVTAAGSGNGSVASTPPGIACVIAAGAAGQLCSAPFATGTAVTLTADPSGGSTFGGWSGSCSGSDLTCGVTITAATQATARFVAPRPAAELAQALLGSLTLSSAEQRELDRFGNKDGTFNLGDLLALLARTGERLSAATMNALLAVPHSGAVTSGSGRIP